MDYKWMRVNQSDINYIGDWRETESCGPDARMTNGTASGATKMYMPNIQGFAMSWTLGNDTGVEINTGGMKQLLSGTAAPYGKSPAGCPLNFAVVLDGMSDVSFRTVSLGKENRPTIHAVLNDWM